MLRHSEHDVPGSSLFERGEGIILALAVLLLVAAALWSIEWFSVPKGHNPLDVQEHALGVVGFLVTGAGAAFGFTQYKRSIDSAVKERKLARYKYMSSSFEDFRQTHSSVIDAFDWVHILRRDYLPFLRQTLTYDHLPPDQQAATANPKIMTRIRDLDRYLEHFDDLQIAFDYKLIDENDLYTFWRYHLGRLIRAYDGEEELRNYVDQTCDHVPRLIERWKIWIAQNPMGPAR